jgi:hypothetical protein
MALAKMGDWIINTHYIQYASVGPNGVAVTFSEGPSTKTVTITHEGWKEFKDNIAKSEAGPFR